MALILNIDTAAETASVSLAITGTVVASETNTHFANHAAWLHVAIKNLLQNNGYAWQDVQGIAVVAGPGSYTGLRVGMAAAKGLCYATGIPLITLPTLDIMAFSLKQNTSKLTLQKEKILYCPMIDARRMEVFTALYDNDLNIIMEPTALVLDQAVFRLYLQENNILFFGNGSEKMKTLNIKKNVAFVAHSYTTKDVALYTYGKYFSSKFADLAYAEPFYLKDFYTVKNQVKDSNR